MYHRIDGMPYLFLFLKRGIFIVVITGEVLLYFDVVGKLVGRVIQNCLQKLAECVLPESQCGFQRGRGCTDMIFVVRQLAEKAIEHNSNQYLVFVDLRKAYDSVPHSALWIALRKLGVPDDLITLIKSFHQDMKLDLELMVKC